MRRQQAEQQSALMAKSAKAVHETNAIALSRAAKAEQVRADLACMQREDREREEQLQREQQEAEQRRLQQAAAKVREGIFQSKQLANEMKAGEWERAKKEQAESVQAQRLREAGERERNVQALARENERVLKAKEEVRLCH